MMRKTTGFTLVEILIVVIILGILAAIVIPQFTEASQDARNSALVSDLQTLRSQMELYKVQHLELYPWQIAAVGTDTAKVVEQLTSKTDQDGTVNAAGKCGPYLQQMSKNPFVTDSDPAAPVSNQFTFAAVDLAAAGDGATGWHINTLTGKVQPNDTYGDHWNK
jgi:general secretion pathway protein G